MTKLPKVNGRYWRVSVELDKSEPAEDSAVGAANSVDGRRKRTVNISFHATPGPFSPPLAKLHSPPAVERGDKSRLLVEDGDDVKRLLDEMTAGEAQGKKPPTVTIQVAMNPPIINDKSSTLLEASHQQILLAGQPSGRSMHKKVSFGDTLPEGVVLPAVDSTGEAQTSPVPQESLETLGVGNLDKKSGDDALKVAGSVRVLREKKVTPGVVKAAPKVSSQLSVCRNEMQRKQLSQQPIEVSLKVMNIYGQKRELRPAPMDGNSRAVGVGGGSPKFKQLNAQRSDDSVVKKTAKR